MNNDRYERFVMQKKNAEPMSRAGSQNGNVLLGNRGEQVRLQQRLELLVVGLEVHPHGVV